jgi:predicted HTH transcriptional regulator
MSESGVKRIIRMMKEEGVLLRIGSDRNGYWQIKTKDK